MRKIMFIGRSEAGKTDFISGDEGEDDHLP